MSHKSIISLTDISVQILHFLGTYWISTTPIAIVVIPPCIPKFINTAAETSSAPVTPAGLRPNDARAENQIPTLELLHSTLFEHRRFAILYDFSKSYLTRVTKLDEVSYLPYCEVSCLMFRRYQRSIPRV